MNILNFYDRRHVLLLALLQGLILLAGPIGTAWAGLSLEQAVAIAQEEDPWIDGNRFQQQALEARSTEAGSFPDPVISAGFANLPTDTFDFNQEAMSQFKIGVIQALPRGDSRELRQNQLQQLGNQHPHQRADRRARVRAEVSGLWLDAWRAGETIRLIERDRDLFEQLVDVAQSNYANSLGRTRQQDLIRAQLELTRLEDRLVVLHEQQEVAMSRLDQWLQAVDNLGMGGSHHELSPELPSISFLLDELPAPGKKSTQQALAELLQEHPAIQAIDWKLGASNTGIALAEQSYRPEWRLNASYGYRDDDPLGRDRADFFSFGVSFDLPLFTSKRQDQQVQSAAATTESIRTDRALLLRRMMSGFNTHLARLQRLDEREALYQSRLLHEMAEQAEASLAAYTSDEGDFAEVVRAKIAELNANIDVLGIRVERQKTIAQLNYFLVRGDQEGDR